MVSAIDEQTMEPGWVRWRQDFHRFPETGFNERSTSNRVAQVLKMLGLEVHGGIGGTGVVASLKVGSGSGVIGLRADMDALAMSEAAPDRAYASARPGCMHACGHDGHMAMLLAAAQLLIARRDFDGTVRFVFQPAEEHGRGAVAMLADGLLERFPMDEIYGAHNIPGMPAGHIATRVGGMMASEDNFLIRITGRGGHAARPHMAIDPLVIGAEIVLALQTIVARSVDPRHPAVLSCTEFITDGIRNAIPTEVVIKGDTRSYAPEVQALLRRWPQRGWTGPALLAGRHADALKEFVVISATDGNHGRALAAAAQSIGCRCVIVLHGQVSVEREQAIAAFGAEIVRIVGHYDESVDEAARLAATQGWEVVSDTSYDGYEDVPRDVMQGYGVIADELLAASADVDDCPWTHAIFQGGVGGMAAGIVGCLWDRYGECRPRFMIVEPEQADCLLQSAIEGRPARALGSIDSVMAGLACGETSPLAWRFLQASVDLFMTVSDAQAEAAMRVLADGMRGDVPIVAGESGAAGLAALEALNRDPEGRAAAGLDAGSQVLIINTEGATAPNVYAGIVGRPVQDVLAAQRAWLQHHGVSQAST